MDITTRDDARTAYLNSGYVNWEWFDTHDEEALITHIWRNCATDAYLGNAIKIYLTEHNQNLSDYGF